MARLDAHHLRIGVALFGSLVLATLSAVPGHADTATQLAQEQAHLKQVQADLDHLTAAYDAEQARYARTQTQLNQLKAQDAVVEAKMARLRSQLGAKAREAYETGGAGTIDMLLSADSFAQFADRVEYLSRTAQSDSDLLIQASNTRQELLRSQRAVTAASAAQAHQLAALKSEGHAIEQKLTEAQGLIQSLQGKLAADEAARRQQEQKQKQHTGGGGGGGGGPSPTPSPSPSGGGGGGGGGGGPLAVCPVGQPRSFTDTFGAPRSGGRTHQGIDLMSPFGTPVYAAQSGRFEQNYNPLGGNSALFYGPNGDYTYYAHMSSYAGVPNGATVSAGTMIGHVGNTGDAAGGPTHLHFEYHPGGGSAVDPYNYLRAVCG